MKIFFAVILSLTLFIFAIPLLKVYQLKGYNCKNFFESLFQIKYSFKGKNKLVFTKRMLRFCFVMLVFEFFCWLFLLTRVGIWWLLVLDFMVNLLILPYLIAFFHYFLMPFEEIIKKYYIFLTKKKLKNFHGIKIAITGSYGKTSTKEILSTLLAEKYRVLASPKNFNTPMGLAKTILGGLKKDTEIIIVEMGARHKGDIKELCELFKPDFAVLTNVGEQHLETFGSLENIIKTKSEICESLPKDKEAFFDCYSSATNEIFKSSSCKKIGLGRDFKIKNQSMTLSGLQFELVGCGKVIHIKTKLLGQFSAHNISLAVMLALRLGIKEKEIERLAFSLPPTKHRLELIAGENLTVIDDAYNSNFQGFGEALNVLSLFDGKKIIVTPGLVELGEKQYEFNYKIGKKIGEVCDEILIMNQTNKKALFEGVKASGKHKKVLFADSVEERKEMLAKMISKGAVVLFENDLPDDYE